MAICAKRDVNCMIDTNKKEVFLSVLCMVLCFMALGGGLCLGARSSKGSVLCFPVPKGNVSDGSFVKNQSLVRGKHACMASSLSLQENYRSVGGDALSLEEMKRGCVSWGVLYGERTIAGVSTGASPLYVVSSVETASWAGGVSVYERQHTATIGVPEKEGVSHTFLALAAPVRQSSVSFETGELAIGTDNVGSSPKRYGPGGSGIGDGNGDSNQSAVEKPTPLSDALGFVLLLAGAYMLKLVLKCGFPKNV